MPIKKCSKCDEAVPLNSGTCECGGTSFNYINDDTTPSDFKYTLPTGSFSREEPNKSTQRNAARIAIESARIVNAYGTYLQILGFVIGALIIIGGFKIAHDLHSWAYGFAGLILGLLDIAIFAIQGAIFRMVSNYVIARLEN